MSIQFLTMEHVLAIHHDQIRRYGGTYELRDTGLLQSALALPQGGYGGSYFHEFPHEMAAAYLFHLCRNHAFVDGNKRVALVAALAFLEFNGYLLAADKRAVEQLVMALAAGTADKADALRFFKTHVRRRRAAR